MKRLWWRLRYAALIWWRTAGWRIDGMTLATAWSLSHEGYEMAKWGSQIDTPSAAVDSELSYWTDD